MGYRNYIWVIDKKKADLVRDLSSKELKAFSNPEDSYFSIFDLREKLKAVEAIELGKYAPSDVISKYLTNFFTNKQVQKEMIDTEISIMDPIALKALIMYYKEEMIKFYKELSKDTNIGRMQHEFNELAAWTQMADIDEQNKYQLTTSWRYDQALFNFMYLYKIFNPKKQYLLWVGY